MRTLSALGVLAAVTFVGCSEPPPPVTPTAAFPSTPLRASSDPSVAFK